MLVFSISHQNLYSSKSLALLSSRTGTRKPIISGSSDHRFCNSSNLVPPMVCVQAFAVEAKSVKPPSSSLLRLLVCEGLFSFNIVKLSLFSELEPNRSFRRGISDFSTLSGFAGKSHSWRCQCVTLQFALTYAKVLHSGIKHRGKG